MAKKRLLNPGDTVMTTLGINMPLSEGRGAPWIKAEVSNSVKVQPDESYESAVTRSRKDAKLRLDKHINWLIRQMTDRK